MWLPTRLLVVGRWVQQKPQTMYFKETREHAKKTKQLIDGVPNLRGGGGGQVFWWRHPP